MISAVTGSGSESQRPVVGMYRFSTSEPLKLASFWSALMDLPVAEGASDELAMLDFEHVHAPVTWLFEQRRDDGDPSSNRVSLDLDGGEAWRALSERAESLGASAVAERERAGARWMELLDPDGNPFRIFAPRPR